MTKRPAKIKGWYMHGTRRRTHVTVEDDIALDITAEASRRHVTVAEVIRDRLVRGSMDRQRVGS